jgi:hypothetical protein
MMDSAQKARREFLRASQNPDGGEPTLYATLALQTKPEYSQTASKAWKLIESWALQGGGWRMADNILQWNWTTSLCLSLYASRGLFDRSYSKGLDVMLKSVGAEGALKFRLAAMIRPNLVSEDFSLQGWPWRDGNGSWVEPTAHAVSALRKAWSAPGLKLQKKLSERVDLGERMLLNRRSEDGGWNFGNRRVYNIPLASYPETTAIALIGLQGNPHDDLEIGLDLARKAWRETKIPLARAWLQICLRNFRIPPAVAEEPAPTSDILLTALHCIGEQGGGHEWLGPDPAKSGGEKS